MTTVENISLSSFYEAIIENAESNILLLDKEFSIISLNPGFYWVFLEAYDIQLKKGEKLFDAMRPVAPLVADRWRTRCVAALKGLSISDEEEFESHGQTFAWKIYYKSVKLGTEQFVSIYSRNISGVKMFQNKILQHEANLRTIINSFNASIWLVNERFELIDFNDHTFAYFLTTYNVTLLPSKNFIDLLPDGMSDLRERWTNRLNDSLVAKDQTSHLDHISINGNDMVWETRIIPVFSGDYIIGLTISMEDVTQKRIDEQLQRTQMSELLKHNTELDKFVNSASYDLRAPLQSIIGVVNVMKRESPQSLNFFNQIESTVKKLENFVTNVSSYSRNNQRAIALEPIDFEKIIAIACDGHSHLDGARIVASTNVINQDCVFICDPERLMTIFRNTIGNAFQYFDKSKNSVLEIIVHVTTDFASIELRDNGIGILPELQDSVFEMFFRGTELSAGWGLGLYIVKNTIEKLEGSIVIKSTPGVGTSVIMKIPNRAPVLPKD
jgi:signal transduction histidine kinase